MKGFLDALQFLTIFRFRAETAFSPLRMIPHFPTVGLAVGSCLALIDGLGQTLWPPPAAAAVDIVFLAVITGALHLDGLGDMADGLYGFRSRERTLSIMKDSRLGAIGMVTMVSVLMLKWAGLAGIESGRLLCLVVVPALARGSMVFGIHYLDYCRGPEGTGAPFFETTPSRKTWWGLAAPVAGTLLLGWQGVWMLSAFAMVTIALIRFYRRRLGCITGDMLGAMTEITEALLFLVAAIRL